MSIPSRAQATRLLLTLDPSPRFLNHASAVAEIASFLAERLEERGVAVQRPLVEAAGLLHDLDKLLPPDHELRPLGHGDAGARWLERRGHGELARPVAEHPVSRLSDESRYRRWASFATREERIVAYADKRAAQHLEPMASRFARWRRRHPDHRAALDLAWKRAQRLERDVCEAAGIDPAEVRRERWVADELAAARPSPGRGE